MPNFYRPPLDGNEEDPFARDGDDKLIRRSYWLDLSDRSIVMAMTYLTAIVYCLLLLLTDICYALVDPRVSLK